MPKNGARKARHHRVGMFKNVFGNIRHDREFTAQGEKVILFLMERISARFIKDLMFALGIVLVLVSPAQAFDASVLDSVVRVKPDWPISARGRDAQGAPRDPQGTGFAILPGGYIVTNMHVIGAAEAVDVLMQDGRQVPAEIVGRHAPTDIALLKIPVDLSPIPHARNLSLADPVCAVGNQFGLGLSVTCGVVSAIGRSGTGFNPIEDFVQTDASINPGGSGGPLLDRDTQLVGMVSAIFTKQSDADIGVNFATSTRLLMRVVTDLRDHGRVQRAQVGFRAGPVPPPLNQKTPGAMVSKVEPEGPAFKAGLEAGDIITHINGHEITHPGALEIAIFMTMPGTTMTLNTLRGDQPRTLSFSVSAQ